MGVLKTVLVTVGQAFALEDRPDNSDNKRMLVR